MSIVTEIYNSICLTLIAVGILLAIGLIHQKQETDTIFLWNNGWRGEGTEFLLAPNSDFHQSPTTSISLANLPQAVLSFLYLLCVYQCSFSITDGNNVKEKIHILASVTTASTPVCLSAPSGTNSLTTASRSAPPSRPTINVRPTGCSSIIHTPFPFFLFSIVLH